MEMNRDHFQDLLAPFHLNLLNVATDSWLEDVVLTFLFKIRAVVDRGCKHTAYEVKNMLILSPFGHSLSLCFHGT